MGRLCSFSCNLEADCKKRNITDPRLITQEDLGAELLICDQKLEELKLTAPGLRVDHLKARIRNAETKGNSDAVAAIKKILQREAIRKRYGRLRYSTKKDQGGQVYSVRVANQGEVPYTTENKIFGQVSSHLAQQFRLAFLAP